MKQAGLNCVMGNFDTQYLAKKVLQMNIRDPVAGYLTMLVLTYVCWIFKYWSRNEIIFPKYTRTELFYPIYVRTYHYDDTDECEMLIQNDVRFKMLDTCNSYLDWSLNLKKNVGKFSAMIPMNSLCMFIQV